ncbi:MAG: hypothetical protein HZA89_15935 [Verrucomicrobia bacterium]|nr:hypothetical protein [Verrucomicrobiota bacterium]
MHYWRQDYFESLRELAADTNKFPEWSDYFAYCELLERGLRKEALAKLNRFVSSMLATSFEERRRFVSWLHHRVWNTGWLNAFIPHPLDTRLAAPTLREWIEREPNAAEPHCWLGTMEHLRRSVTLDPLSEVASTRFIRCILGGIDYATHELPAGYLGDDPFEDLADLATAEKLLNHVRNLDERVQLAGKIAEVRRLLGDYISERLVPVQRNTRPSPN